MSDKPSILERMKQSGDDFDNPVIEAVTQIADYTVERSEKQDKQIEALDTKVNAARKTIVHETEKVRTEMETGFKMVADKLEAQDKRRSAIGGIGAQMFSATDKVLSAIPESKRHLVRQADAAIRSMSKSNREEAISTDPILRAATGLWYANTMRLQMRGYAQEHESSNRELAILTAAFDDAYGKTAYSNITAANGGYLVPEIIAADILRIVNDSGVVVSRARHIPMSSDDMKIPNEATGVGVSWISEAGTLTGSESTFGQNTLTAKKLIGRATMSREVVDDSVVAIIPYIQEVFAEKFGRELDYEALEGTGGNFTGVVTETGINSEETIASNGTTVRYEHLAATVFAGGEESTRMGSAFFMSPKIFATVVGLVDTSGQPIFQYANVPGSYAKTILGFPVFATNVLSTDITRGTTGSTGNIYFGDPRKLIFGDRSGLRFEVTDQVGWANDQIDARMIGRWGFTIATPASWTKLVGCAT